MSIEPTKRLANEPRIARNPQKAAKSDYDLIVIGGGIVGAMTALEAARRNVRTLLLEKDDFGGATSFNSLKTIHGGLRHLQFLDFPRHRRFVTERRWFLTEFPGLVTPLPVLMPLYGRGLRRTNILRGALALDRALSRDRNDSVPEKNELPDARVISAKEVQRAFPLVDDRGLQGGAVWYDARVPDTQRLIMEVVGRACDYGAVALNYVEASGLDIANGVTAGVQASDTLDGSSVRFSARTVINAAGPWSRRLAALFDRDIPKLFHRSMAWNVLLDRKALSEYALALETDAERQVYFVHPWKGRVLVGTGHAPGGNLADGPMPSKEILDAFMGALNRAVPRLNVTGSDVLHVYAGFLPVQKPGSVRLTNRPTVVEHQRHGGPARLVSVVSEKFTAARYAAELALNAAFGSGFCTTPPANGGRRRPDMVAPAVADDVSDAEMRWIIASESVHHLDDLILRRTTLGDDPKRALHLAPRLCDLFGWDEDRRRRELQRLEHHFSSVRPDSSSHSSSDTA